MRNVLSLILGGGRGTRLFPLTKVTNKHLLPVGREPMIYHPVHKLIEAGVTDSWRKYVGLEGGVVGIDRYGESAPAGELFKYFGFTVSNVVDTTRRVLRD